MPLLRKQFKDFAATLERRIALGQEKGIEPVWVDESGQLYGRGADGGIWTHPPKGGEWKRQWAEEEWADELRKLRKQRGLRNISRLKQSGALRWPFRRGAPPPRVTDPSERLIVDLEMHKIPLRDYLGKKTKQAASYVKEAIDEFRFLESLKAYPEVREHVRRLFDTPLVAHDHANNKIMDVLRHIMPPGSPYPDLNQYKRLSLITHWLNELDLAMNGVQGTRPIADLKADIKRELQAGGSSIKKAVTEHIKIYRQMLNQDIAEGRLPVEARKRRFYAPFVQYTEGPAMMLNRPFYFSRVPVPFESRLTSLATVTGKDPTLDYIARNTRTLMANHMAREYVDFTNNVLRKVDRMPWYLKWGEINREAALNLPPNMLAAIHQMFPDRIPAPFGVTKQGVPKAPTHGMEMIVRVLNPKTNKLDEYVTVTVRQHRWIPDPQMNAQPFQHLVYDFVMEQLGLRSRVWSGKGGRKHGYGEELFLIPRDVYRGLLELDRPHEDTRVYRALRTAGIGWKRYQVMMGMLPFHTNNLIGDLETVFLADAAALGELIRPDRQLVSELRARMQNPAILKAPIIANKVWLTLLGVKGAPGTTLREFQDFLDKYRIVATGTTIYGPQIRSKAIERVAERVRMSKTGKLAYQTILGVPEQLVFMADIVGAKREQIMRLALAARVFKLAKAGKRPQSPFIDTRGLDTWDAAGKIARETLGDVGAVSTAYRTYIRDGLAPFIYWYAHQMKLALRGMLQTHHDSSPLRSAMSKVAWDNRVKLLTKIAVMRLAPLYFSHVVYPGIAIDQPEYVNNSTMVVTVPDKDNLTEIDPRNFYLIPTGSDTVLKLLGVNTFINYSMKYVNGQITWHQYRRKILSMRGFANSVLEAWNEQGRTLIPLYGILQDLRQNRSRATGERIFDPEDDEQTRAMKAFLYMLEQVPTIGRPMIAVGMAENYMESQWPGFFGRFATYIIERGLNPNPLSHIRYSYRPLVNRLRRVSKNIEEFKAAQERAWNVFEEYIADQLAQGPGNAPRFDDLEAMQQGVMEELGYRPNTYLEGSGSGATVPDELTPENYYNYISDAALLIPMLSYDTANERLSNPRTLARILTNAARKTSDPQWSNHLLKLAKGPLVVASQLKFIEDANNELARMAAEEVFERPQKEKKAREAAGTLSGRAAKLLDELRARAGVEEYAED